MPDEMFFTPDERSLRRGKRREARTPTCRPCVIQTRDGVTRRIEGVVLDMNAYGLRVRALDPVPIGSRIAIQFMRDDSFRDPISRLLEGSVVRREDGVEGFADHGVRLDQQRIHRPEPRPVEPERPRLAAPAQRSRMHTLDVTIGDTGMGSGRRRIEQR